MKIISLDVERTKTMFPKNDERLCDMPTILYCVL